MTINSTCLAPVPRPFREGDILAAPTTGHRVLARNDAVGLFGASGLRQVLNSGEWIELWPGVLVAGAEVHDPMTRGAAALLRAGPHAVLSSGTAVAMHGCAAAHSPVVEVTVPYDRQLRSRPGLVVHQGTIAESEVVELDGLRTQALDVALADLLCRGRSQRTALECLSQAMLRAESAQKPGSGLRHGAESLRAMVAEHVARRRDRRGTRRAAAVLELARDPAVGCSRRAAPRETTHAESGLS